MPMYEGVAVTEPGAEVRFLKGYDTQGYYAAYGSQAYSIAPDEYCDSVKLAASLSGAEGQPCFLKGPVTPACVPGARGIFEENLILFDSAKWASGGVNIGGGTAPETFKFLRNAWYCQDVPGRSRPQLPTPEEGGVY